MPDLEQRMGAGKRFALLKKLPLNPLLRSGESAEIYRASDYTSLVAETKRARELFPYF